MTYCNQLFDLPKSVLEPPRIFEPALLAEFRPFYRAKLAVENPRFSWIIYLFGIVDSPWISLSEGIDRPTD